MRYKILIITVIFLIFTTNCSILEKTTFYPSINQGIYLSLEDISKINLGMTQQQIINILGTPVIIDPFDTNSWFYIFYQLSRYKIVTRQVLLLNFNKEGILININNNLI